MDLIKLRTKSFIFVIKLLQLSSNYDQVIVEDKKASKYKFIKSKSQMPKKKSNVVQAKAKPLQNLCKKSIKMKFVGPEVQMKKGEITRIFTVPGPVYKTTEDVVKGFGYCIQEEIDSGAYGTIHKVLDERKNNIVAGKIIKLGLTSSTMLQRQESEKELLVMERVRHPYIVDVYCHFVVKSPEEELMFIFMQLADGGNFSIFLKKYGPMLENKAKLYYAQMLCGVNHMHNMFIAHRDIKLQNILLVTFPKSITGDYLVLIADFGVSHVMENQIDQYQNTTLCGTPAYMSPEILQKKAYSPFQADVYALGVVLFMLMTGVFPFNVRQLPNKILRDQIEKKWKWPATVKPSNMCTQIIKNMLEPNPWTRIKLPELIHHEWIISEFKMAHDLSDSLK